MTAEKLQVEIAAATMNLYPYNLPDRPTWGSGLDELVPFLEQTDFCNYELHPTKPLVEDIVRRQECGDTELANTLIGSQHQVFFDGSGALGRLADRRGVYRSQESIGKMAVVQAALDRPVPTVYDLVIAQSEVPLDDENTRGALRVVQPTAEAYAKFGINHFQGFVRKTGELGMMGLCPDTVHFRRVAANGHQAPGSVDDWAALFASGRAYETHVASDRRDMAKRDADMAALSAKEFRAFTSRSWKAARATELGEMVVAAVESWKLPPELEASNTARMVAELPPMPAAILRRQKQQAQFVENLANIVHEAGAEPVLWSSKHSR